MKNFSSLTAALRRSFGRYLLLGGLLATAPLVAQAQNGGVGIGTTAPDVSAALDIVSSSKGALLPRVADATAIATPATGLLVFQTGGTPGFYYNVGTPAAPSWQQIATAAGAAVTASNGLTKTGTNVTLGGPLTGSTDVSLAGNNLTFSGNGNVGIGTSGPGLKLDVAGLPATATVNTQALLRLSRAQTPGVKYGNAFDVNLGSYGTDVGSQSQVDLRLAGGGTDVPNVTVLSLQSSGNVGIGTTTPGQKLDVVGNATASGIMGIGTGITNLLLTLAVANPRGTFTVNNFSPSYNTSLLGTFTGLNQNGPQLRFQGGGSGGYFADIGQDGSGNFVVEGNDSPRLTVLNAGNVGIDTATPTSLLDLGSSAGAAPTDADTRKLAIYNNASGTDFYGFGISSGSLHIFTNAVAGAAPDITIRNAGNVGIGTSAPAGGLHLTVGNGGPGTGANTAGALLSGAPGSPPYLELRGSSTGAGTTPYLDFAEGYDVDYSTRLISQGGVLGVRGAGSGGLLLQVNGGGQASNVTFTSDARFKQHVRPLTSALAGVLALRGVRYEWNALGVAHGGRAGAEQVGLLAQELEKVYPELVSTDQDGYKAVNYAQLTPVLIEALKEQQAQIEALKARAATAEARAATATAALETFEARLRRLEAAGEGQAHR